MGCFGGRSSLASCASWAELAERTKPLDDNVASELAALEKVVEKDRTAEQKAQIAFYGSWSRWNNEAVRNRVFEAKAATLAETLYANLDSDKTNAAKTKMESDFVALSDYLGALQVAPVAPVVPAVTGAATTA